jgi:gas vesicle protein
MGAGAALALLYAPQSGARTRRQLRRGCEDARDYVRDAADNVSDQAEKYLKRSRDAVEEVMGDVVDSAQNLASGAKRVISMS